jgi:hypothetical protein
MRIRKLNITWGTTLVKTESAPQPAQPYYRWKDDSGNIVYGDTPPAFVQVSDPRYVLAAACKNHHVYEISSSSKFNPGPLSICNHCGKRVYWCVAEELLERRPEYCFDRVGCLGRREGSAGFDSGMVRVKERKFYRWVK